MTATSKNKRGVRAQTARSKRDPFGPLLVSLLTLDWEITDENIQHFEMELKSLKKKVADDRHSGKLIDTALPVCHYLRVRKGSALPASMQFLHSATRTLLRFWREKIRAGERKQALEDLLVKFRSLMADVQKLVPEATKGAMKTPGLGTRRVTAASSEVLEVIKARKNGTDVATLKQITGFTDGQIRSIIYRANRQGKIKRISRGVYVSV